MILNPIIEKKVSEISHRHPLYSEVAAYRQLLITLFVIDTGLDKKDEQTTSSTKMLEYAQLIERKEGRYVLREPLYVGDTASIAKPMTGRNAKQLVMEKVDEYRACFSKDGKGTKGLRPGSMGDKNDIVKKLAKWFKETDFKYTMEDVINTAKVYVDSCKAERYRYLQAADYFISKDGRSNLSAYIDEFKDRVVDTTVKTNTLDI